MHFQKKLTSNGIGLVCIRYNRPVHGVGVLLPSSADGVPISAEDFLKRLFDKIQLPALLGGEEQLRKLLALMS